MDPMTALALGGALMGGRSGGGKTSLQATQTSNISTALNNSVAFNPVVAAITGPGAGVAPSISGPASGGLTQTPTVTSSPSMSEAGAGGVVPRGSPTGFTVGPGSLFYPNQPVPRGGGIFGDDFFLLLIIGGALYFSFAD